MKVEKNFISLKGKFYELITENESFLLLADTYLELYEPSYTAGIQEKPEPTYRRNNSLLLYVDNKIKKTSIISSPSVISISSNVAHLLIAKEDSLFFEVFENYEATVYPKFRKIVEDLMK